MRENTFQKNSKYGHFSRSEINRELKKIVPRLGIKTASLFIAHVILKRMYSVFFNVCSDVQ